MTQQRLCTSFAQLLCEVHGTAGFDITAEVCCKRDGVLRRLGIRCNLLRRRRLERNVFIKNSNVIKCLSSGNLSKDIKAPGWCFREAHLL